MVFYYNNLYIDVEMTAKPAGIQSANPAIIPAKAAIMPTGTIMNSKFPSRPTSKIKPIPAKKIYFPNLFFALSFSDPQETHMLPVCFVISENVTVVAVAVVIRTEFSATDL